MDEERLMERVRRLLAMANDPAASDNEQQLALERAQKLMDEHAIDQWRLEQEDPERRSEITVRKIRLDTSPVNRYMGELCGMVARANRCRCIRVHAQRGNGRHVLVELRIVGVESDINATEMLWTAMETSRAVMWRVRARQTRNAKENAAWRNGYYQGYQDEIGSRFLRLRRAMESDGDGHALILARTRQVDDFARELVRNSGGPLRDLHEAKLAKASRAAYRHGRDDGRAARLGLKEAEAARRNELCA